MSTVWGYIYLLDYMYTKRLECMSRKILSQLLFFCYTNNMQDKKMYSARIDPSLHKAVKMLSVEMEKSIVALTEEALRDLLKKYEKKPK